MPLDRRIVGSSAGWRHAGIALLLLFQAGSGRAAPVELIWSAGAGGVFSGLGTSTVGVSSTAVATLSLDVRLDVGSEGFVVGEADFEFDPDLANELDVLSFAEIAWTNAGVTRSLVPLVLGPFSSQESSRPPSPSTFPIRPAASPWSMAPVGRCSGCPPPRGTRTRTLRCFAMRPEFSGASRGARPTCWQSRSPSSWTS